MDRDRVAQHFLESAQIGTGRELVEHLVEPATDRLGCVAQVELHLEPDRLLGELDSLGREGLVGRE